MFTVGFVCVMLGSSNVWSGGVAVALLTDGGLHEVYCLTCNGITDLTHSIIPTLVLQHWAMQCHA